MSIYFTMTLSLLLPAQIRPVDSWQLGCQMNKPTVHQMTIKRHHTHSTTYLQILYHNKVAITI